MFKFLVDHNVPNSVTKSLQRKGYNVKLIKEIDPEMSDQKVVRLALKEDRILLSNDKDFIHLSSQHKELNLILFDYSSQSSELRIHGMNTILPELKIPFGTIILH